jgi:hypothetical protein
VTGAEVEAVITKLWQNEVQVRTLDNARQEFRTPIGEFLTVMEDEISVPSERAIHLHRSRAKAAMVVCNYDEVGFPKSAPSFQPVTLS